MRRDGNAGGCVCVGVGGDIGNERAVGFLREIAVFEIAAGGVVCLHAAGRNPFKVAMRGDRGVGFFVVAIIVGVAGEGVRFRAVGEVIDVFRADDVREFERGFAAAGLALCLTLSWRLGLGGQSGGS